MRAVIETPRRSPNKYKYEPKCGALVLSSVMPQGVVFPYDFGFVPSTLAEDGDPIDVLLLMEEPAIPLSIVRIRLIGAIEAEQKDAGEDWERNDRLVAVATHAHSYAHEKSLKSLRPHLVEEIVAFFEEYNRQHGGEFRMTGLAGPDKAGKAVARAERRFTAKRK